MRVHSSFFAGMNWTQYIKTCTMNGDQRVSVNVFNELVGKRLRPFVHKLWKITQRLVLSTAGNMHLNARSWDGHKRLGITVSYDTRWQKCRGWNSLSSTSYGVDAVIVKQLSR